jgi:hypothetical protein
MPVYKYKTYEEASLALINMKPDKKYYERIRKFYKLVRRLNPSKIEKGIKKIKQNY